MKKLTKLLLTNWYNYQFQIVDFDTINFITGKTGSGKSTIIDAMQLVLYGDTRGTYFNKAANQKSNRDLKGYLYCDIGDDGDVGTKYKRDKEVFSTHVALEFFDDKSGKYNVFLFVADCQKDLSISYKWFVVTDTQIPSSGYIQDSTPMSISALRRYFDSKKINYSIYDTNVAYQKELYARMGYVGERYNTLLRKAVPFAQVDNIASFITENICSIDNDKIDIEKMAEDIRSYRSLEEAAELANKKIQSLERIEEKVISYNETKNEERIYEYVIKNALLNELKVQLDELNREYTAKIKEKDKLSLKRSSLLSSIDDLTQKKDSLNQEKYANDSFKRHEELKKELSFVKEEIQRIEFDYNAKVGQIRSVASKWIDFIVNNSIKQSPEYTYQAKDLDVLNAFDFNVDALKKELDGFYDFYIRQMHNKERNLESLNNELDSLRSTIKELESGIKPYPRKVQNLINLIKENLNITPMVFADEVDLKNEDDRSFIEAYLADRRFTLFVPGEYEDRALELASSVDGPVSIACFDNEVASNAKPNSLFNLLMFSDARIESYGKMLLSDVVLCDNPSQDNSLSRDLTLIENGALWRLDPEKASSPFIGKKSIELILNEKRRKADDIEEMISCLNDDIAVYRKFLTEDKIISLDRENLIKNSFEEYKHLDVLENKMNVLEKELSSLDMDYINKLDREISHISDEIKKKKQEESFISSQIEEINPLIWRLENEMPSVKEEITTLDSFIKENYEESWIQEVGDAKYQEILSRDSSASSRALSERYSPRLVAIKNKLERYKQEIESDHAVYNSKYHASYDIHDLTNAKYNEELIKLKDNDLPEYIEKIESAKEKAIKRFQNDFISRIRGNIEDVESQVAELNRNLKTYHFGTDTYRFSVSPNKDYEKYYYMFKDPELLSGGDTLFAGSFRDKYKDEMDTLFMCLMGESENMDEKERRNKEKLIQTYTDYRTYLSFDLNVTNEKGETQRLSKTFFKKSGGEGQLPFYIALLASFSNVCRVRQKTRNDTIRLVILDEAFSKLDGERIREGIKILQEFNLQAVFSAPPEKVPDIAPLVNKTLIVYKDDKHSFVREFQKG